MSKKANSKQEILKLTTCVEFADEDKRQYGVDIKWPDNIQVPEMLMHLSATFRGLSATMRKINPMVNMPKDKDIPYSIYNPKAVLGVAEYDLEAMSEFCKNLSLDLVKNAGKKEQL